MPKLLEQARNCLRVRHYSYHMEKAYVLLLLLRITAGGVFGGNYYRV